MTRRERMERRLARREQWADSARAAAKTRFAAADRAVAGIEPGQPILVGHHSEKRHRRALERCDNNMRAGFERQTMAGRHDEAAANLEHALERTIFSDDENAIQALEARIAERESKVARMKALNVAIRREMKKGEGWLDRIGATDEEKRRIKDNAEFSWDHKPCFPSYAFSNLSGANAADRKRLEAIKRQQAHAAQAEAAGGVVIVHVDGDPYCRVTFAEKPERPILDALHAADFHYGQGSWYGQFDKLPKEVSDVARAA